MEKPSKIFKNLEKTVVKYRKTVKNDKKPLIRRQK